MRGRCFTLLHGLTRASDAKCKWRFTLFFPPNTMISQSITIRLELTPQDALLLAFVIGQGLTTAVSQKIISPKGAKMIETTAQSVINQIQNKTDFDQLRAQNDLLGGLDPN